MELIHCNCNVADLLIDAAAGSVEVLKNVFLIVDRFLILVILLYGPVRTFRVS